MDEHAICSYKSIFLSFHASFSSLSPLRNMYNFRHFFIKMCVCLWIITIFFRFHCSQYLNDIKSSVFFIIYYHLIRVESIRFDSTHSLICVPIAAWFQFKKRDRRSRIIFCMCRGNLIGVKIFAFEMYAMYLMQSRQIRSGASAKWMHYIQAKWERWWERERKRVRENK